jgi:hypothetical protein
MVFFLTEEHHLFLLFVRHIYSSHGIYDEYAKRKYIHKQKIKRKERKTG